MPSGACISDCKWDATCAAYNRKRDDVGTMLLVSDNQGRIRSEFVSISRRATKSLAEGV